MAGLQMHPSPMVEMHLTSTLLLMLNIFSLKWLNCAFFMYNQLCSAITFPYVPSDLNIFFFCFGLSRRCMVNAMLSRHFWGLNLLLMPRASLRQRIDCS